MSGLPITFACGLYDRMLALHTGEVKPDGIDLNFLRHRPSARDLRPDGEQSRIRRRRDVELGLFLAHAARGDCPMVAIPVFPSRVFRHGYIAIDKRVIREPKDLAGKRIGVPLYTMTAAIVIRGLLQHDYGVDFSERDLGRGRHERHQAARRAEHDPAGAAGEARAPTDKMSLNDRLESGDIAAIIGSGAAEIGQDQSQHRAAVSGLPRERDRVLPQDQDLPDHASRGAQARRSTRSIRSSRPASTTPAATPRRSRYRKMRELGTLRYMLPWMAAEIEEIDEVFGGDPWPYGIDANRPSLEALVQYLADQALIEKPVPVESLFAPIFGQASKP